MSRFAVPPQRTSEFEAPESIDEAPTGTVSGPVLDASPTPQASQPAAAGRRGAAVADEPEDWDPPASDIGEEDQSLEAPDDDAQAQAPYC